MAIAAPSDPAKFEQAVAWFRKRVPIADHVWETLDADQQRKAFKVAGVANLDLVAQVHDALTRAVENGTTLADFKKAIGDKLRASWAGAVDNPPARIETIFRTNVQLAYGAGRYQQMTDPAVAKFRPYFHLDTIADQRQSPICAALTTPPVCLPQDDPFWDTHIPPLHHRCRSGLRALRKSQAAALGITTTAPVEVIAGDGFGGRPGESEWEPDISKYPRSLVAEFKKKRP